MLRNIYKFLSSQKKMEFACKIIPYNGQKPEEKLNQLMKIFFDRVEVHSTFNIPLEVYLDGDRVNIRPSRNYSDINWGFEIKDTTMENKLFNCNIDKIIRTESRCYTLLRIKGQEYRFEHYNQFKD
jgi:hypothetical protein